METVVERMKAYWPDLHITKENLQHPTPEIILQIYSHFILKFEEMISFAIGCCPNDQKADLEPEEQVFIEMQKFNIIFERASVQMFLGDIYQPTYVRTKNFLFMCCHLLTYFQDFFPTFEKTTNDIIKMREEVDKLCEGKNDLLNDINKYSEKKADLQDDLKKLQEDIEIAEKRYEDYCNRRIKKQRERQEKRKELDRLKLVVDEKSMLIEKLQTKEKQLIEETITEEEFLQLNQLEKNLKEEKESLGVDDINMQDLLSHEYGVLDHFKDCGKAIPDNLNVDFVNKLISMEVELEDFKINKEKLLSDLSSHRTTQIHEKKLHTDEEAHNKKINIENQNILKVIKQKSAELSQKLQKYKEKMSTDKKRALTEDMELKIEISQLEHDLEKLRDHFRKMYIKVAKAEEELFKQFRGDLEDLQ